MPSTDPNAVRDWLKALGGLCAGNMPVQEVEARLSAYASLLADEFGPECFTMRSLAAVARACKFFPSFSEVCAVLSDWWKEHRPIEATLIEGPPNPFRAGAWDARNAADIARTKAEWADRSNVERAVRALDNDARRMSLGGMLASAVLRYAPQNADCLPQEFIDRHFGMQEHEHQVAVRRKQLERAVADE